jgi:hypothetical protein
MAGILKLDVLQLGDSGTAANNLVVQTNDDGTFTIARGNVGGSLTTIASIDANGNTVLKEPIFHAQDQKAANTAGGSSVAGADTARNLNVVLTNDIAGASLAANQIVLPAGTYFVEATAPAYSSDRHRLMLYNVTDAAVSLLGTTEASSATVTSRSVVKGRITITAPKTFELRHRVATSFATNGFGFPINDGRVEIYTEVKIIKEA